ncbi:hypothetical protein KY362_04500 [Candidatus Woesearchaeota archaeon]|nr:hypothetical protein [Candidatus Woesearchaeota archaeon]
MNRQRFILLFVLVALSLSLTAGCGPLDRINDFFANEGYQDHAKLIDFGLFFIMFFALTYLGLTAMWGKGFGQAGGAKGPIVGLSAAFGLTMAFAIVTQTSFSITSLFPLAKMMLFLIVFFILWGLLMRSNMFGRNSWANRIVTFILAAIITYILASIATHMICQMSDNMDDEACESDFFNAFFVGMDRLGVSDWFREGRTTTARREREERERREVPTGPAQGGCRLDIGFPKDSAQPDSGTGRLADYLATVRGMGIETVYVYGFASSDSGGRAYNLWLSRDRGSAIATMINSMETGVRARTPVPKGPTDVFGESAQNQRVVLATESISGAGNFVPAPSFGSLSEGCPSQADQPCDEDTPCAEGLSCVEGRCQPFRLQICEQDSDCPEGQRCGDNNICQEGAASCQSDMDCGEGQRCENNVCTAGALCDTTRCPPEIGDCYEGVCAMCDPGPAPEGLTFRLCPSGHNCECDNAGRNMVCDTEQMQCVESEEEAGAAGRGEGEACNEVDTCADGLSCVDAICRAEEETGETALAAVPWWVWLIAGIFALMVLGGLGYFIVDKIKKKNAEKARLREIEKKIAGFGTAKTQTMHNLREQKKRIDAAWAEVHKDMTRKSIKGEDFGADDLKAKALQHLNDIEQAFYEDLHWKDIHTLAVQYEKHLDKIKEDERVFERAVGGKEGDFRVDERELDALIRVLNHAKKKAGFKDMDPGSFKEELASYAADLIGKENNLLDKHHRFFREEHTLLKMLKLIDQKEAEILDYADELGYRAGEDDLVDDTQATVVQVAALKKHLVALLDKEKDSKHDANFHIYMRDDFLRKQDELIDLVIKALEVEAESCKKEAAAKKEEAKLKENIIEMKKGFISELEDKHEAFRKSIDDIWAEFTAIDQAFIREPAPGETPKEGVEEGSRFVDKEIVDRLNKRIEDFLALHYDLNSLVVKIDEGEGRAALLKDKELKIDHGLGEGARGKLEAANRRILERNKLREDSTDRCRRSCAELHSAIVAALNRVEELRGVDYSDETHFRKLMHEDVQKPFLDELRVLRKLIENMQNQEEVFSGLEETKKPKHHANPLPLRPHFKDEGKPQLHIENVPNKPKHPPNFGCDEAVTIKPGKMGTAEFYLVPKEPNKQFDGYLKIQLMKREIDYKTPNDHPKPGFDTEIDPSAKWKISISSDKLFRGRGKIKLEQGKGFEFGVPFTVDDLKVHIEVPDDEPGSRNHYLYLTVKTKKEGRSVRTDHNYRWIEVSETAEEKPEVVPEGDRVAQDETNLQNDIKEAQRIIHDAEQALKHGDIKDFLGVR